MDKHWYQRAYRRHCLDMHITADDERFMAEFDPQQFVDMLLLSGSQSTVLYAHSHVGLCYFPTRLGPMHPGLRGRDIFGEVVELAHRQGIAVIGYYSLIFDTWAYRSHPDWRIIGADGVGHADRSRYGVCCPNSPYREYTAALAGEICARYDIEGIRFDMTFWPAVCFCRHCQNRFAEEVGGPLPRVVNWEDPHWVSFARNREQWLVEFAALQTHAVKQIKPDVTVEHQSSTYVLPWRFGVTTELAAQNDFLQGDFYGDALQGSFVRKLLYNLTVKRPSAFETSIGTTLQNYTALKSPELLEAKACAATADGAAFVFIDSVDPVGTLNRPVYERMGQIFAGVQAFEPYRGGELCQDVAIYLSTESKFDPADNGKAVHETHLSTRAPHVEAAVSACKTLIDHHVPFGVITKANLGDLARYPVIILPNVLHMSEEEAGALREYVRGGGRLYASKTTSLIGTDGRRRADFLLADVFGVSHQGETHEQFTYIAPAEGETRLPPLYTPNNPPGVPGSQMVVQASPSAQVLGQILLPYTDPAGWEHFASIHNNPPGVHTEHPAIVLNAFGAGHCIYVTGDIESHDAHRPGFMSLIRLLYDRFTFTADAPKAVEITCFHQADRGRYVLNLINFQKEMPNIPVDGIHIRLRLDGRTPRRVIVLPSENPVAHEAHDGCVTFTAPRLETFAMLAVDYN